MSRTFKSYLTIFPIEIICEFVKHLNIKDTVNLQEAYKLETELKMDLTMYSDLNEGLYENILSTIVERGFGRSVAIKFLKLINDNGCVISGSIPLSCIVGDFECGDIDVYTIFPDQFARHLFMKKIINLMDYKYVETKRCDYYDGHKNIMNESIERRRILRLYGKDRDLDIGSVYDMNFNGILNIQIINLDQSMSKSYSNIDLEGINPIINYIRKTFDLDFCKCVFDGCRLVYCDKKSLISRKCSIGNNPIPSARFERIVKYINRGFDVEGFEKYYNKFLSKKAIICATDKSFNTLRFYRDYDEISQYNFEYERNIVIGQHMNYYLRNISKSLDIGFADMIYGLNSISQDLILDIKKYILSGTYEDVLDKYLIEFFYTSVIHCYLNDSFDELFIELNIKLLNNLGRKDYLIGLISVFICTTFEELRQKPDEVMKYYYII